MPFHELEFIGIGVYGNCYKGIKQHREVMNRMRIRCLFSITAVIAIASLADAQPRRATFRSGGDPNRGKCTIEVVVDGAADVEVRGDTAFLRNLSGQPPQWRRFECSGPLPANPADFRFAGVDGRGRQTLIQDPRNGGGSAVVRIEDPQGGSEGYTFDLFWANSPTSNPAYGNRPPDTGAYYREREAWFRGDNWRGRLFQRVRQDVDYVQSVTFPGGGDQFRLARTRQELDELQDKLAAGRYDERELDEVIAALQRVVQDNRMARRDRDLLNDDLNRLSDFRARHEEYGARESRAGGDPDDAYHRDRDESFRDQNWRGRLFQRVREDVDHIQSGTFSGGADQYRFDRTRQELNELQGKLAAGRYDERELDEVIGALQRVVGDNRLRPAIAIR